MSRPQYLMTASGAIRSVPHLNIFTHRLCRHDHVIAGEACSGNGFRRISGEDRYAVCVRCGKILYEDHVNY